MSFATPYMLWGAAAAGIPIALHFFFRSRYRTVPWAAMKFLLTSIEQTSRRLRFQELLLLVLRVMLLVLLALALARPLGSLGGGDGDTAGGGGGAGARQAVDAVFLFDTSYSMAAKDGEMTRFARAKAQAKKVLDELPARSTVQIIACADRAGPESLLGPTDEPADLDKARSIVDNLKLTHLATDLYPGVSKALDVLERSKSTNREFYIFSDMQASGWNQQAEPLVQKLKTIKEIAAVNLVRCGNVDRKLKNAALIDIKPQSGTPRPGERVGFAVIVKNTGPEMLKGLEVSLMVDNDKERREAQPLAELAPGETRVITLTAKFKEPGLRMLSAQVAHDDLDADNRLDQVIRVQDKVNILVVDGFYDRPGNFNERDPDKCSSYYLMEALMPVPEIAKPHYYRQARVITPRLASAALLQNADLCILVNVSVKPEIGKLSETLEAEFVKELAKFVRSGKGLMIFAGDNVSPDAYNEVLGKNGLLPGKILGRFDFPVGSKTDPLKVDRHSFNHPAYAKFKEDDFYKLFNDIEIYRTRDVEEPPAQSQPARKDDKKAEKAKPKKADKDSEPELSEKQVLLRYSRQLKDDKKAAAKLDPKAILPGENKPAVLWMKADAGQVVLITTAADVSRIPAKIWSDWPTNPANVPFLDVTLNQLLHGQSQTHNLVAGQTLRWYPTEKESFTYTLINSDREASRLGKPVKSEESHKRPVVSAKNLHRAGVYRLKNDAPLAKGKLADDGVPIAVAPDLRESEKLESLPDAEIEKRIGFQPRTAERGNRDWTEILLFVVLFVAIGESALAWWCGRAW